MGGDKKDVPINSRGKSAGGVLRRTHRDPSVIDQG